MGRFPWNTSRLYEGVALVTLSAGFVLTLMLGWDNTLASALRAIGFLVLALTSTIGKTYRWLCFGLAVLGAVSIASDVFSVSSPFSDATVDRIGTIAALALLIVIPILFIREHVAPTSKDFREIERAHKEAKRREREQHGGGIN